MPEPSRNSLNQFREQIMEDAIQFVAMGVQSLAKDEFTACFVPRDPNQDYPGSSEGGDVVSQLFACCYWIGVIIR